MRSPIYELLAAYIREHAAFAGGLTRSPHIDCVPDEDEPTPRRIKVAPADVQAVATILGRVCGQHEALYPPLDLKQTDLAYVYWNGAQLRNAFLFEFETVSSRRIVRSSHESIDPLTGEVIVETDSSAQQLLFGLVTDMRPHTLALKWPVAFEADQTARWRLRPNAALRAIVAACQG